jgi:hypothetical protein
VSRAFLNLSNHPCADWSEVQTQAALALGASHVQDLRFPQVDPNASTEQVQDLARQVAAQVAALQPAAVHVAGELCLTLALVGLLQAQGLPVVCATTRRDTTEETLPDGSTRKLARFHFVQWRAYPKV